MLGKLIKNEFIQRGKQLLTIFIGTIILSLFVCLTNYIYEEGIIVNSYFEVFNALTVGIYILTLIGIIVGIIAITVTDFGNRLFKDQGYLTHTLPVSTFKMILSRMVYDLFMIAGIAALYPLSISIVFRDFSFYEDLIDVAWAILDLTGSTLDKVTISGIILMIFIALLLGSLLSIWHFQIAYAIGSMFSKSRKSIAVAVYIGMYLMMQGIIMLITKIISKESITAFSDKLTESFDSSGSLWLVMLGVINIVMIIGILLYGIVTNLICKHRLNLE